MDAKQPLTNTEPSSSPEALVTPNAERSDAELYLALKQGQTDALGILYDRHAGLVYAIALKMMKNAQDAEDLTQEVFLQLAKTPYDPRRGSLRTFLVVLTRSRSLDGLRSRQRAQTSLQHWQVQLQPDLADVSLERLYREECVQEVQTALAQLSDEQQRVLRLAYHEGLSQSAIAEQLGSPLGTVKAWARRGLLKLRQSLEDGFEDG
jgi:RNA polymerase sigma-70 factor, ECF subfamily